MMNVLDFEVLNGSPGDKQTNKQKTVKRFPISKWNEISEEEKKAAELDQSRFCNSQLNGTTLELWRSVHKHEQSCLHDHDLRCTRFSL